MKTKETTKYGVLTNCSNCHTYQGVFIKKGIQVYVGLKNIECKHCGCKQLSVIQVN